MERGLIGLREVRVGRGLERVGCSRYIGIIGCEGIRIIRFWVVV